MIHNVFTNLSSVWPRIGLVLFVLFFAVVLFWTLRGSRNRFDRESRLPFDEAHDVLNASPESERS